MPDSAPFVSVLLPVYNGENTLKATIESLMGQTYKHFEILMGIDGTTDGSKVIAESFGDSRIRIIEHPVNLGLAKNLNALIEAASNNTEFFAMAEQDDVYVPQRLEWQVKLMKKHPKVGLVSGIAEFKSENRQDLFPGILAYKKQFPQGKDLFTYLYQNQLKVVNTCMMIRKETHEQNSFQFKNTYDNFNVDWDYVLRFALKSQVYGLPKVLVRMNRYISRNSVTTNKRGQFKASRQLLKDFKKEFPNLINKKLYNKALKTQHKIELGHRSKMGIIVYGIWYAICYLDSYFLKYILERKKKYFLN
ncbi:glycosyltransferase family 2 protein [Seonamhaeicola maritimus]|uniref:Glycosyltransferase n=1 Tax=Seonamhaeicola maritimus TaxID=2591822 RepID=A0A5C7GKK7_9FLAO|nr:glycosyltransferase [Seonamhaeicola maritimus]TXG38863.1 glycosyltransferase [Seonamhaeicola maritimus]